MAVEGAGKGTEVEGKPPVSLNLLESIVEDSCQDTFRDAIGYEHEKTQFWNNNIISKILEKLISAANTSSASGSSYKYAVNSTIIQNLNDQPTQEPDGPDSSSTSPSSPRRGMHSAMGAFWNNATDGMWHHKYTGAEGKGIDVVVSVIWVSL